jgi:hypothetical protein
MTELIQICYFDYLKDSPTLSQTCFGATHQLGPLRRATIHKLPTQLNNIWVDRGKDFHDISQLALGNPE